MRNQPTVILVTGLPGTGKTTLAKQISTSLQLPYFSKDSIKERLFDTLGYSDRAWSKKVGIASYALFDYIIDEELRSGRSIVLESNFSPVYDDKKFQVWQSLYAYKAVQVVCSADRDVLLARFMERAAHGDRHPGHAEMDNADEWKQTFTTQMSEPLNIVSSIINVETTDFNTVHPEVIIRQVQDILIKG